MRHIFSVLALSLVACGGGDDDTQPADPCDAPGAICTWAGVPGQAMFAPEGEDRLEASMYLPQDIAFGSDGIPVFPDFNNHRVRHIGADDKVYTITGTGMLGDGPIGSDGCYEGTPCDAMAHAWNHPTNVAIDPDDPNIVWVAAWHNSRINKLDLTTGEITWHAGNGGRNYGGDGGPLGDATLDLPSSVAFDDRNGDLYFSDQANHIIRKITRSGEISTIAGQPRQPGYSGDGGPAVDAMLHGHTAQKADPGSKITIADGMLYLTDTVNGIIRVIDLDAGTIDLFAGKYTSAGVDEIIDPETEEVTMVDKGSVPGFAGDGGPATEAVFNTPRDVAVGIDGEVYIADTKNSCVRVITPDGIIDTFAGQCGVTGFEGDEGPANEALLGEPFGVEVDAEGNLYIADTLNHVFRRVKK